MVTSDVRVLVER